MTRLTCPGCGRAKRPSQRYCSRKCLRAAVLRIERDRFADDVPLQSWTVPWIAKHSSTCPLCPYYIAAGRSTIVAIEPPLMPRAGVFLDKERLAFRSERTGDTVRMKTHAYVHEHCFEREEKRQLSAAPTPDPQPKEAP